MAFLLWRAWRDSHKLPEATCRQMLADALIDASKASSPFQQRLDAAIGAPEVPVG